MDGSVSGWVGGSLRAHEPHAPACIYIQPSQNTPHTPSLSKNSKTQTQYFAREKDRLLSEVDAKGSELAHALATFQEAFDAERRERLEREGRILRQLGEHEQEVARRFEAERVGGWVGVLGCGEWLGAAMGLI